ncbi:hypothetical protein [Ferrimicrobium sp.]|uniref:hypothetical protein n=1 Tax=Ferrimicrobium sp. TaxID=2926050 RepID=UPI00262E8328|nr:hypothetical protein [Ferrimicrobium sp.]
MVMLVIGVFSLAFAGLGIWWFPRRQSQDRELNVLAKRLETEVEIQHLTHRTLAEMRKSVRQDGANGWWYW